MGGNSASVVRIRKNVATLGSPGDDLDWYAKAVAVLQKRALNDPTGWRYLGAVHGYPGHTKDPLKKTGDKLPSTGDRKLYWNQCQHQSWYFLPWHRGYLACFEEIIAAAVVSLGGPPGWALPYWDYSDSTNPNARSLPAAFLKQFSSGKTPNPLWLAGRSLTKATEQIPAGDVDLSALLDSPFAGSTIGGDPGFGGPNTGFSHFGGVNGRLENLPHNQIHDDVGGLMSDPDTAALDPIFWLHHSNIDRLWEVWTHRNPAFTDPTVAAWLTGVTFKLHDATGAVVTFQAADMLNTQTVRHGYVYANISDPFSTGTAAVSPTSAATLGQAPMAAIPSENPTLVAASQVAIPISGAATSADVPFHQPARLAATARLAGARPVRAFLNLENVTGTGLHGSYEVYIDAPSAGKAKAGQGKLLAGHLSTFGVEKASQPGGPHGGSGITSVLEITHQIEQLHIERGWKGDSLQVTFVPKPSAVASTAQGLKIGRISVYYA